MHQLTVLYGISVQRFYLVSDVNDPFLLNMSCKALVTEVNGYYHIYRRNP